MEMVDTYGRLAKDQYLVPRQVDQPCRDIPGTTSLASMASPYSMKPNPFMSFTSVMVPVPSLKCAMTSSLVTASRI